MSIMNIRKDRNLLITLKCLMLSVAFNAPKEAFDAINAKAILYGCPVEKGGKIEKS